MKIYLWMAAYLCTQGLFLKSHEILEDEHFQATIIQDENLKNSLPLFLEVPDADKPAFLQEQNVKVLLKLLYDLSRPDEHLRDLLGVNPPYFFFARRHLPLIRRILKERFVFREGLPLNL